MKAITLSLAVAAGLSLASAAAAQPARPGPPQAAARPVPAPSTARLRATVEKLVSFGTRHTMSDPTDPRRGIGAARSWAAAEFQRIGQGCGGCLRVERISRKFTGPRSPGGVMVEDVLAIQRGPRGFDQVVIVAGHIDSRVTDVMNASADSPGANDDGSGSALVLEAARLLAGRHFQGTVVYALLSGEEQGLWGGTLLAETARARGWNVVAMLNNDIIGNTVGTDGRRIADRVRVFSEGIGAADSLAELMRRRASGSEDDGPSRALMKKIATVAQQRPGSLSVFGVRRPDRFGRGGDHEAFLVLGYPAVRFTSAIENYDAQHQDLRTENGRAMGDTPDQMDFPYLAKVTALNTATIAELASAPPPPARVTLGGAVSSDTQVAWTASPGADHYRVYWRPADQQNWQEHRDVSGTRLTLPGVIVDDSFVGVAAVAADGSESLVTFGALPAR